MKISLNWLKKYVKIPDEVSNEELVRLIGARLVEVEGVVDETHKYDKIYVVRVESCEKIPETHLTLCQINVGSSELVQVVCGAPNVRAGMLAAWIAPGAIVPASVHEDAPFVIGKRKMRGFESNGMLAGADELDFGDDHSGIVEIDPEMAQPGDMLAQVFELEDLILEIENKSLTHRPDTFGIIGFAREVAGILGEKFVEPDLSQIGLLGAKEDLDCGTSTSTASNTLTIAISDVSICPRYTAAVMEKHGELKRKYLTWVDTMLAKSGMKPISPIVDATNYLMLLTGQPLHAFDYDKFVSVGQTKQPKINIRLAKEGEKLVLLDGKEIDLNENDIVICSGDVPVALAGAMGGASTAIDEETKNIILESATFSLYNLRKTQMSHGVFTEAITRFTKGQPAYQTLAVAEACASMLRDGFKVTNVVDEYPQPLELNVVKVSVDDINGLLGTQYDEESIVGTLSNVGFKVEATNGKLSIVAPEWRTDIHIKEDIIEEVGRLRGYDNIMPSLPLHATANRNAMRAQKQMIRELLSSHGANEVLTYSFVSEKLMSKAKQDVNNAYRIVNSISPELQYFRQSIVPSLLEKAFVNQKLPVERFAMFEMNEVHRKEWGSDEDGVPVGKTALGFVLAERKNTSTAFYKAKKYVAKLFDRLGIDVDYKSAEEFDSAEALAYEPKRSAVITTKDGQYLGVVGEFKNSVRNEFKLAPYLAGFEIVDLGQILQLAKSKKTLEFGMRKSEDLTVTTDKSYSEALAEVSEKYPDATIQPLSVYQAPGQKTRNISFRILTKR